MSKVLVLGDSIAYGLANYLGNNTKLNLTNAGIVGENISSCRDRSYKYKNYNKIIIATSTNDWGVSSISKDYDELVDTVSINNPSAKIYSLASPGVTSLDTSYPHVDNDIIVKHNKEISSICSSCGAKYIDIYNLLNDQNTSSHQYRQSDGLHLNNEGYSLVSSRLGEVLAEEGTTSSWTWPVPGYGESAISSYFGNRVPPTSGATANHGGIDIAAPEGTSIVAANSGTVISSGPARGYGNWIRIDHGNGIISIYGHMKTLLVSVGQEVRAGEVIALVASEGTSTGNHLHFQIELNGTAVDPLNYVSPDGATIVNSNNYTSTESSPANIYTLDAAGITAGQRVSGLTSQPIHAFVNIYVGSDLLLLSTEPPKPNILQMFEYNRMQDAGESASFTVFDRDWEEIEEILSKNFDRIYIEYGYYGTGLKSKLVKHRLLNYSISFESNGATLSVSSVTEGVYDNLSPRSLELDTFNPTEAVKKICLAMGYTVLDENFDESQDIHADNPFNLIEDFPITYIQSTIIPQSAQENEELFTFNVDADGVAYFKRESYDSSLTDNMRTYIWQKGYDSPVIDLSFDLKGVFGGSGDFEIATGYKSTIFDTKKKTQEYYEADKSSVVTVATGDSTFTKSTQSNPVVDSSGYSPEQMRNRLYYYLKSMRYDAYEATMTIIGDPTIGLNEYIRIINVTDKGSLHHTSGVYRINDIIDSIQGGEMTTTLKLVRNASYNIEGLEILNPKLVVK